MGGISGQVFVSTSRGELVTAHMLVALAVTAVPHTSKPRAVNVSVKLQTFVGTK